MTKLTSALVGAAIGAVVAGAIGYVVVDDKDDEMWERIERTENNLIGELNAVKLKLQECEESK